MIYTTCKTIKIFFWLNIQKLYKCITISRSICSKGFTISEASEDLQITAEVRLEKNMLANFPNLCKLSYKVFYICEIPILVNVANGSGKDQNYILTLRKGLIVQSHAKLYSRCKLNSLPDS